MVKQFKTMIKKSHTFWFTLYLIATIWLFLEPTIDPEGIFRMLSILSYVVGCFNDYIQYDTKEKKSLSAFNIIWIIQQFNKYLDKN